MRATISFVFLLYFVTVAGCVSLPYDISQDGSGEPDGITYRKYQVSTILFQGFPSPKVIEKSFRSKVEFNKRHGIKSYRFSNYFQKSKTPSVVVVLAISGQTAGMGIYDSSGAVLAEYSNGRVAGDFVYFDINSKEGSSKIKWFLGVKTISSVIESYTKDGVLGQAEVTIYKRK